MSLLRAFIAIEIPAQIHEEIADQTAELRRTIGNSVRWVAIENVHLTLKFLGEISSPNIGALTQALEVETRQHPPFEISVGNLGVFPNPRRPRIIWIGLDTTPALEKLQRNIEASTARLGYPVEDKPFSAHLTIGRVREQISAVEAQTLRHALENTKIGRLGTFAAKSVHLFRSDLQRSGPLYTSLFTTTLGG